jgi:hypothetical protein
VGRFNNRTLPEPERGATRQARQNLTASTRVAGGGFPRQTWRSDATASVAFGGSSRALTVSVTRDIGGLRLKNLLVHAAYGLAKLLDAGSVAAISNTVTLFRGDASRRRVFDRW